MRHIVGDLPLLAISYTGGDPKRVRGDHDVDVLCVPKERHIPAHGVLAKAFATFVLFPGADKPPRVTLYSLLEGKGDQEGVTGALMHRPIGQNANPEQALAPAGVEHFGQGRCADYVTVVRRPVRRLMVGQEAEGHEVGVFVEGISPPPVIVLHDGRLPEGQFHSLGGFPASLTQLVPLA